MIKYIKNIESGDETNAKNLFACIGHIIREAKHMISCRSRFSNRARARRRRLSRFLEKARKIHPTMLMLKIRSRNCEIVRARPTLGEGMLSRRRQRVQAREVELHQLQPGPFSL